MTKKFVCTECKQTFSGDYRKDKQFCPQCKTKKQYNATRRWAKEHPEQVSALRKEETRRLKAAVLAFYGGHCACCGESQPEFLTIDHIDGGGTAHRAEIGRYGSTFYQWLRKNGFPPGYRVLCYNCNCSRGNYGYCPHRS